MKGLTESTLDGWFKRTVELLKPLYEGLKREVFSCDYVQADETTVPVINREKHRADKEYLWMVRSVMEKLAIFHYDGGSRAGAVIESMANQYNFKGYLQCDGFAGYETAFKTNPDVRLLNCLVHIRRHFEQALDENKEKQPSRPTPTCGYSTAWCIYAVILSRLWMKTGRWHNMR